MYLTGTLSSIFVPFENTHKENKTTYMSEKPSCDRVNLLIPKEVCISLRKLTQLQRGETREKQQNRHEEKLSSYLMKLNENICLPWARY